MITERDFLNSFDEIIESKDKIIVIYSGIWSFINKIKFKIKKDSEIPKKY